MLKKLKLYFKAKKTKGASAIKEIAPAEAAELVKKDSVFVDVREPQEISSLSYQVKKIVTIPLSSFEQGASKLPKDKHLIMVCRSGNRSLRAAKILQSKGYENISNLSGGIMRWKSEGFSTVSK